jgi:5-methyltetrahydropteroyltriglutamate--homocysteine methyltransferase
VTAQRATDAKRVRADHTGALKRPDWLLELYAKLGEGQARLDEVRQGQDKAIREVIAKQEAVGMPVVTDGEFARIGGFQESFGGAVTGFDAMPYVYAASPGTTRGGFISGHTGAAKPPHRDHQRSRHAIANRLPTKERLKLVRNLIGEEYKRASAMTSTPVKVTLIGPDRISQRFEYELARCLQGHGRVSRRCGRDPAPDDQGGG